MIVQKAFITMRDGKDIIRVWTDKKGEAYKVEFRLGHIQGYNNPDAFVRRVKEFYAKETTNA